MNNQMSGVQMGSTNPAQPLDQAGAHDNQRGHSN